MDLQIKTQNMVNEAIATGLEQLEKFKEIYAQFPRESKEELKDATEEWLIKNDTPCIRPWCLNCKKPLPGAVPLVSVAGNGNIIFNDENYFKNHYFNDSVRYRTCLQCNQTHPRVV